MRASVSVSFLILLSLPCVYIYKEVERKKQLPDVVIRPRKPKTKRTFPVCGVETEKACSTLINSISTARDTYNCSHHHVFLFSHRRSGTHMTINLLRYGFESVKVWKMNHASCANCTLIASLEKCGMLVHAMRNPLDVAVSMYDYVKGFNAEARNKTFNDFVAVSSIGTQWASYIQNCKSVPDMIHLDFEMTRAAPQISHRLLAQKLRLPGQWTSTSIPHTGAVSFKGGRVDSWESLSNQTLRTFLHQSLSTSWGEQCSCETSGHANDGHSCLASIKSYY